MITTRVIGPALLVPVLLFAGVKGQCQDAPEARGGVVGRTENGPQDAVGVVASRTAKLEEPGSDVRIIRLSQVKGSVQMDRGTGHGYEQGFVNLPVVQGAKLKTGEGVAEVEFEDNSTLRLTPETEVEFPKLRLDPAGVTLSTIHVLRGTVYASQTGHKSESSRFAITFGEANRVTLPANSHILLTVDTPATRLAVFEGVVAVEYASPGGTASTTVAKKHTLLFDQDGTTSPKLVARVDTSPFDGWDKDAAGYHNRYASASAFGGTSGYGVSDLNYYGSFVNLSGCGPMWRPFFTSAAWDPFANGVWAWYPGAGYSWVSPYPWGWAPFHTGSWQQCGDSGWGWRPGGKWVGLRNSEKCPQQVHGPTHYRPPTPPAPGHPTMVAVNARPIAVSGLSKDASFVFAKDSAGFGVPRQTFGKLAGMSADVTHHGTSARQISVEQLSAAVHGSDGSAAVHSVVQQAGVHPGAVAHGDMERVQGQSLNRGQVNAGAQTSVPVASSLAHTTGTAAPAHGGWSAAQAGGTFHGEGSGGGHSYAAPSGSSSSGGAHAVASSPAPSAPAVSAPAMSAPAASSSRH